MSNYIEFKDTIAFHPGYYIKEIVDDSGLTQEDFAKRLDTTPKNLSLLLRGEQSLSIDIAMKLSRMIGTSVNYWLNLQNIYDSLIAEFKSEEELEAERKVFELIDYKYFKKNYKLLDYSGNKDLQIGGVRKFLDVATLTVLKKRDMAVNYRSSKYELDDKSTVCANIMVQIAANIALHTDAPRYDKRKFERAVQFALRQTTNHEKFYPLLRDEFNKAGVIFVILPNINGSTINGATKKIGNKIMLMVNDRKLGADSFWFTLFHEIGHIINGDFGISFEEESGDLEEKANRYAEDSLILPDKYKEFVTEGSFTARDIRRFADEIGRDPGIVLGRLENDEFIGKDDASMKSLRHKYKIMMAE